VRIFKTKSFTRVANKLSLNDADLCEAVASAEKGLIDADFGGGVIKQRIAREGEGKSGGFRTIILLKSGERAVFVEAFAKNERGNITKTELKAFKQLAKVILTFAEAEIAKSLAAGAFVEVFDEDDKN
jgi:hypothetical protein